LTGKVIKHIQDELDVIDCLYLGVSTAETRVPRQEAIGEKAGAIWIDHDKPLLVSQAIHTGVLLLPCCVASTPMEVDHNRQGALRG
jgi:hypothetical protein